jgi:hypothetical protein
VLATQAVSDFGGEATQHLVFGVDHEPLALNLMRLGRKGLHGTLPS